MGERFASDPASTSTSLHVAYSTRWPVSARIFEVWESQEALQQLFEERLGQALQQANINAKPMFVQIVNTMQR